MKTTSRLALIAAAGMLFGAAIAPAKAADLGGGCCADLEERVAELEATTARKGNRVVSLQVYGQVNKSLLIWDDGVDSDAFVVDNDTSGSRLGIQGAARISSGLTAGYLIEFDYQDAASNNVTNATVDDHHTHNPLDDDVVGNKNGDDPADEITIRQNKLYIEHDRLGRITLGHGSTASDGANEVVLANSLSSSFVGVGNSLNIRYKDNGDPQYAPFKLKDFASNLDGGRNDVIRYDTPSIYGFILSASWGDNDYADVALRFKKEFNSIRIAAAVAYQWDTQGPNVYQGGEMVENVESETLSGSVSVMHVPTGLYAAFAAGQREYGDLIKTEHDADYNFGRKDSSFWYVQAGIEQKFLPYGKTTIYGEYGVYSDMPGIPKQLGTHCVSGCGTVDAVFAATDDPISSEATRLGFGIVQKIDAAAMDIYAQATFWDFEATDDDGDKIKGEDMSTIMVGSRIKF